MGALIEAKIPLRLINGAADPISGAHMAARYRKLVPHADCILLNGIGHYPQVEVPSRVAELFLNFHDTRVTIPERSAAHQGAASFEGWQQLKQAKLLAYAGEVDKSAQ